MIGKLLLGGLAFVAGIGFALAHPSTAHLVYSHAVNWYEQLVREVRV